MQGLSEHHGQQPYLPSALDPTHASVPLGSKGSRGFCTW